MDNLPASAGDTPLRPGAAYPTPASLRRLLEAILLTAPDFEAFCADYFPEAASRFSSGNDRVQKITLLFSIADHRQILERLRDGYSTQVAQHEGLIEYTHIPMQSLHRTGRVLLVPLLAISVFFMSGVAAYYHSKSKPSVPT